MPNPLTIYNSFAGDPDQDAKTLAEYAKVGFGDETTMPTAQNLLDNVKLYPEAWEWLGVHKYLKKSYV